MICHLVQVKSNTTKVKIVHGHPCLTSHNPYIHLSMLFFTSDMCIVVSAESRVAVLAAHCCRPAAGGGQQDVCVSHEGSHHQGGHWWQAEAQLC